MELHYLIRSKQDGKYLTARIKGKTPDKPDYYLFLFKEYADALSYLNTHAKELAKNFTVESISASQVKNVLQRWGFQGIGLIEDPLLPQISFLTEN